MFITGLGCLDLLYILVMRKLKYCYA